MAGTSRRNFFQSLVKKKPVTDLPIDEVAGTGDFEQGPVEGADVAAEGEKMYSRKDFLRTSGATLAGLGLGGSLFSCKQEDVEPEAVLDKAKTPNVTAGKIASYYGEMNEDIKGKLEQYEKTIVEPGHMFVNGKFSDALCPKNAYAYVSLNGIFQQTSDPELQVLRDKVKAIKGYLMEETKDLVKYPTGMKEVMDPNGEGAFILDLKRPEVRNLIVDHIVQLAKQYPKGVYLDAMDSTTKLERDINPVLYAGLTDGAIQVMKDASARIKAEAPTKGVIVNGGLYPRKADASKEDVMEAIAKLPNLHMLSVENWYTWKNGDVQSSSQIDNDTSYIKARLTKAINAAKSVGVNKLSIYGIEPAYEGQQVKVVREAAERYQGIITALATPDFKIDASLYACNPVGHKRVSDLDANTKFAAQGISR